jgi:signal transduction histidine kinase
MTLEKDQKQAFSRKLSIVSASVLLVFCLIVTIQAVWTHDLAIKRGEVIANRLTKIESENLELSFNTIRMALKGEAEKYYYNSLFSKSIKEEMELDFKKMVETTPQIGAITISDAEGNIVIAAAKNKFQSLIKPNANIGSEDFFKYHKKNSSQAGSTRGEMVSVLKSDELVSQKLVVISYPIYKFDGSFDGVITVTVDIQYFFEFFESMEIGDKIGMGIVIKKDQVIKAEGEQRPQLEYASIIANDQNLKGKNLNEISVHQIKVEGKDYLMSFKKLHRLPIVISLAFDEEELLTGWRNDRMTDLVFLILFTVFGGVLFSLILAMAKQIQRAEESEKRALLANQAKSEFFAKMSHELRTPLNAIIGFSEMIDNGYFGPLSNKKQQERVHDINLCGNHLLQLINDILDYSKGEAGKLEIREGEVVIARVVEDSLRMVRERAKKKNQQLDINVASDLPGILADERKIKQILLNLLSNATKFTPENGKIEVRAFLNDKSEVEISVKDSGIGIPPEDIPVALSVFGQVKNRANPEEEGTGLGLPLCKMLTELHGGKFVLESELGKWTKATVIIPPSRVIDRKIKKSATAS